MLNAHIKNIKNHTHIVFFYHNILFLTVGNKNTQQVLNDNTL